MSQPQRAPLYNQQGSSAVMLAGAAPASGLTVYLLNHFRVPSWTDAGSAPAVPLVPYMPG